MKKLLLIPILLGSMAIAQDYKYEITPVIGYNIAEGNLDLDNQFLIGAEFQYNDCDALLKPELSILYTDADYENSNISTDIFRIAINGVHEYNSIGKITPLTKIGVGYEIIDRNLADNKDSIFFNAGVGAKVPFTDNIALKLEAVYMLKNNNNRWDNNLALLAGINFAFGPKAKAEPESEPTPDPIPEPVDGDDDRDGVLNSVDQCPNTPAGKTVNSQGCFVDGDDDRDGVLNSVDQCPDTPAGKTVNSQGCFVDGDDDRDGVLNSVDQCPNTPAGKTVNSQGCFVDGDDDRDGVLNSVDQCPNTLAGKTVNSQGCFIDGDDDRDGVLNSVDQCPTTLAGNVVNNDGCTKIVNLYVNFENNSYVVDEISKQRVKKFANFLKARSNFTAQIIGHTNGIGRELDNQILSENRANAVKDLIIEYGVAQYRVSALGKGESNPTASNNTAEGLAQNRRIEAILNKN